MKKIGIVGAGPAGVIAGSYLIKAGFDVTIYEKNSRVISTPCGEAISQRALIKLREDIDFDSSPHFSSSVKGLKLFFPGGYYSFAYEPGHVLEREEWIDAIRQHFENRGGKVLFNSPISDIDKLKEDIVIGADGPISIVRRKIGGIVEMCTAVQYKMELDWPNRDMLEFYWDFDVSDLYGWNFPKKDYFNVGVIGNIKQLDRFCEKYHISGKIIKKEGYALPFNGSKIHEGRYFLVGDSAGMVNALSKGGLASIVYASDILSECLTTGTAYLYEQRIRKHPAFSETYGLAMRSLLSLNQNGLEILGKISQNRDILNLPLKATIQALGYPRQLSRMQKVLKAFKTGSKYAW